MVAVAVVPMALTVLTDLLVLVLLLDLLDLLVVEVATDLLDLLVVVDNLETLVVVDNRDQQRNGLISREELLTNLEDRKDGVEEVGGVEVEREEEKNIKTNSKRGEQSIIQNSRELTALVDLADQAAAEAAADLVVAVVLAAVAVRAVPLVLMVVAELVALRVMVQTVEGGTIRPLS
jgi:hypothetical protein